MKLKASTDIGKKTKIHSGIMTRQREYWAMCAIPMLLVFVFSYIPMFGIIIAFKDYRYAKGIFGSEWIGFKNFEFFFKSNDFANITFNTLYMNTLFIVFGMVSAILLAILLFNVKSRRSTKIFQTTLITPHFISWVIVAYMVYGLLNPRLGIINTVMQKFGGESIDWYSKPDVWPIILVVVNVWKHFGMDSVMYYAALMGVDESLLEAADLDGANKIQKVWYVMLPEIVPVIIILFILKVGAIFNADFGLFYQVTRDVGALYDTTDVLSTYIFRTMINGNGVGISAAAGFLQSFVGMILVVITNYIVKKVSPENSLY